MKREVKRSIGKVIVALIIVGSLVIITGAILVSCNLSLLTVKGSNHNISDTTTDEVQAEVDDDGILKTFTPFKKKEEAPKVVAPKPTLKLITKDTLKAKQLKDTVNKSK